eukprot:10216083-Alexandrium_andersonii.AAC.1
MVALALLRSAYVWCEPFGRWWHPITDTYLDHERAALRLAGRIAGAVARSPSQVLPSHCLEA